MRRLRRVCLTLLFVVAVVAGAARYWLSTTSAANYVTGRVADAVGQSVAIGQLDLGWSSTRASTIAVGDWLTVASADVAMSVPQLLRGDAGGEIVLRDAAATLRFDADNHLLTPLPKLTPDPNRPVPRLRLDGGTLTLAFPHRSETFRNLRATLHKESGRFVLDGTADDADWGPWTIAGHSTANGFDVTLTTRTPVHVTPAVLRRVPFVKASVWDVVTAEGDTPVEVALRFVAGERVRYRVSLQPKNTHVFVTVIDLNADAATGKVVIEDGVVTLDGVRGKAAGGDLSVNSTMDFRATPSVMKFAIQADKLTMGLLPERWRARRGQGRLSGTADLTVTNDHGKVTTSGSGVGELRTLPLLPPLKIRMRADGDGYSFDVGL